MTTGVLLVAGMPHYVVRGTPFEDSEAFVAHLTSIAANVLTVTPLFLGAAGCATLSTRPLPRSTGSLACVAELLGLGSAPAIYGGKDFLARGPGPGR